MERDPADRNHEVWDEVSRFVSVATRIAYDPGLSDAVIGDPVDMAVDPEVRAARVDQVTQVRGVAPAQVGVQVGQAVRVRGVVGDDHGRAFVRDGQRRLDECARPPVHGEDLARFDPVA